MSYILDALRKADAERERDPARGIHAHPVAMEATARSGMLVAVWAGAAAGLAAVAAFVLWPRERAPVAPPAPPVQLASVAPPADPAPAKPAPAEAVLPPAPPQLAPMAPAPARPVAVAAAVPGAIPNAAAVPTAMPKAPAASAAAAAPAPATAGPSDRIFAVAELPADIQRELPKLPITGGVYSENASQRMLIVSGVVAKEGMEIAPGLVVEQIRPKMAVLKFRGWKYSVGY